MLRNHAVRESEAHSVTGWFGSKEGNEDALKIGNRDPDAGVCDFNYGPLSVRVISLTRDVDADAAFGLFARDCLGRITNNVNDCLAKHALISADGHSRGCRQDACAPSVATCTPGGGRDARDPSNDDLHRALLENWCEFRGAITYKFV